MQTTLLEIGNMLREETSSKFHVAYSQRTDANDCVKESQRGCPIENSRRADVNDCIGEYNTGSRVEDCMGVHANNFV